jgi:hypothetical protein
MKMQVRRYRVQFKSVRNWFVLNLVYFDLVFTLFLTYEMKLIFKNDPKMHSIPNSKASIKKVGPTELTFWYGIISFITTLPELIKLWKRRLKGNWIQAFLDFRGFDFRNFLFNAAYNSILFSSPLVLLSNLDLCGFCFRGFLFVSPH